jgi:small subunit ribosomal protein S5
MADEQTNQESQGAAPASVTPTPAGTPEVTGSAGGAAQPDEGRGRGGRGGGRGGRGGGDRGGPGGRGQRRSGGEDGGEFDENVVKVYRCATVVKGGRRFSFSALVVVGDRKGRVGIGYGKANEVPSAVEKGNKAARRNMIKINMQGTSIPHQILGRYGASRVALVPAGEGTGVIAGASVRSVLELAGIKDVLTKCYGSTSPKNLVRAAFLGLKSLRTRDEVARLREVEFAS